MLVEVMNYLRERINGKYKLETLSVLVVVMALVVLGSRGSGNGLVSAQALGVGPFTVPAGLSALVNCSGNTRLTVSRVNSFQVRVNCAALAVVPTPTKVPLVPTVTLGPITTPATGGGTTNGGGSGVVAGESIAMNTWSTSGKNKPNPSYDKCDDGTDVVTAHKTFFVLGPDGKKYPTWHSPVVTNPVTGNGKCYFGHEHGRDPKGSAIFTQAQEHSYFDANKNGAMDASEKAVAGIPFGYANEQLDLYSTTLGTSVMRHEDHVGHKIDWANGEADIATDQFDNSLTGGVVVPVKNLSGSSKWNASGARCYHLAHAHQGVNSPDAFTMNLHEVSYFSDCKGPIAAYDMKNSMTVMMQFGKAGEFTNLCDGAGDRTTPVVLGTDSVNAQYPGTRDNGGARLIIQRSCIEKHFLVPQGTFSSNFYEAWPSSLKLRTAAGKELSITPQTLFDVEDASRYYWPGHTDPATGQANTGRSMDLCYENLNGRQYRGITCDVATNYGAIKGITWDSPKSAFRGVNRGMYFQPPVVDNAGGPEFWFTDPFGGNAKTTSFPGSIKQTVVAKKVNHNVLGQTDPRVNNRTHSDGNGTVHAPN